MRGFRVTEIGFSKPIDIPNRPRVTSGSNYHKPSNIRRAQVGNKIVDHSNAVGASPVGAALTTSSSST